MKKVPFFTRDRLIVSIDRVYTPSTFYMKSSVYLPHLKYVKSVFQEVIGTAIALYLLSNGGTLLLLIKQSSPVELAQQLLCISPLGEVHCYS